MFNVILDTPPTEWRGHLLKTDFKQGLKYFRIIANPDFSEETQFNFCIRALFEGRVQFSIEDIKQIKDFFLWYITGGNPSEETEGKQIFDFNIDHGRLFSAFWQTYKINLKTIDLHWWEFLELFAGIDSNTLMMKVIEIREKEVPKKGDAKEKRKLRKAKRRFAINPEKAAAESDQSMNDFFKRW